MVLRGSLWHGVMDCGIAWYSVLFCSIFQNWFVLRGVVWYCVELCGAVWYSLVLRVIS